MTTRVLIADDEPLIRSGMRLIVDGHPEIEVVGEAANGEEATRLAAQLAPHLVFMDIRMPVMDGIEATRRIRAAEKPPFVIMLTAFDTEEFVLDAVAAGASGFLLKTVPPQELVSAVISVMGGAAVMDDTVLRRLVGGARRPAGPRGARADGTATAGGKPPTASAAEFDARVALARLSEREQQVARLVAQGLSNADIAGHLFVSLTTVKTHIARIFGRLGIDNRVQLAVLVLRAEDQAEI